MDHVAAHPADRADSAFGAAAHSLLVGRPRVNAQAIQYKGYHQYEVVLSLSMVPA